jgi:NTE family protein
MAQRKPRIGIALGAGSARGWAHIGVLQALLEAGIVPELVCGTSIGALVGAVYADDETTEFERWVKALTWRKLMKRDVIQRDMVLRDMVNRDMMNRVGC